MSDPEVLRRIERRVLWLATSIVDHANRLRDNPQGLKVGGHQASSASMVSIMTELWFEQLRPQDRVSVKPHASPVLHAIEYLLGTLDASYLPTLRAFGGLQSYPSRLKDPVPADYSTGSVGIGATAPIWGAMARRYVNDRFVDDRFVDDRFVDDRFVDDQSAAGAAAAGTGRHYSLVGDAELDEGAIWEAVLDPAVAGLGELVWIVDFNRQSLDRVVPTMGPDRLSGMFAAAGWQVITVKYGERLTRLFERPGGAALRQRIDTMSNGEYQRLLRLAAPELVRRLPGDGPDASALRELLGSLSPAEVFAALRDLGGHDVSALRQAFDQIDDTRPTVLIAYTVKGYGLATEGHPQNHSSLLNGEQIAQLADRVGVDVDDPWATFDPDSPEARLCAQTAERLARPPVPAAPRLDVPTDLGRTPSGTATTQAALGRALVELTRSVPAVGSRLVTVSPDVSSSTNLGGWVNKVGVWAPDVHPDWFADDGETILHWQERPTGQHIELGIAETNLVGLIGELGTTWSRWGQPLLPIGVLYDPFVGRALEPWSFGVYAGGQSILVGTPSGVTLAAEGGAHQSITTPSIGLEQPGCLAYEPAFVLDTEWCLLAALARLGRPDGCSAYLRLSTRPIDQTLADVPTDPAARERRRRQVVAGGYPIRRAGQAPDVTIAVMGALVPEALAAAGRLTELGQQVDVVCVTSPGLLFEALRARAGYGEAPTWILEQLLPAERRSPVVTVLDGHPHTLAFLAEVQSVPAVHLGVTRFGQSGDLSSVYRYHGIDADSIVAAGLDVVP